MKLSGFYAVNCNSVIEAKNRAFLFYKNKVENNLNIRFGSSTFSVVNIERLKGCYKVDFILDLPNASIEKSSKYFKNLKEMVCSDLEIINDNSKKERCICQDYTKLC